MKTRTRRARLETDPGLMAEWLRNAGYPGEVREDFLSSCIRIRVEVGGEPAAYVWMHWWEDNPDAKVLIIHACSAPEFLGRWLDHFVANRVFGMAELAGAHGIWTQPFNLDARLRRLYRHLGFKDLGEDGVSGFYLTL